MKITDIGSRAAKTFVQAFLGALIPQIALILTNILEYDWANWKVWLLPIVTGAIAAGISATWNNIINHKDGGDE